MISCFVPLLPTPDHEFRVKLILYADMKLLLSQIRKEIIVAILFTCI